ncbi:MAG: glycosyltransferase family 4 protein [Chloroflexaceae bacterium]|nr:glycosyltransferase family 4 protein [Chloroflexaceae bacterium]
MIVGVDYTAAAWQGAGIGRLTRELIRSVVELDRSITYRLFFAAGGLPKNSPYLHDLRQMCEQFPHVCAFPLPFSPRVLTIIWQRLRLRLLVEHLVGRIDVVHAPDFVLPPTRAHTILTVHDLTFLRHPECFEPSLQHYLVEVVPRSLDRADTILADSQATAVDLTSFLGIHPQRIQVIYPGVSEQFRPLPAEQTEAVRKRLGLPNYFLLFVGTLEPRKNLVRLLEAYHCLLNEASLSPLPDLVIAGRRGWLYEGIFDAVDRLGLRSRVLFLDFVADGDLPALYNLARVFVYPSLYEGFGLPVIEAMACGTAVVTANVASLPEAAGEAAILVNPENIGSIMDGILEALTQSEHLASIGKDHVCRFNWGTSAQRLLTCYRQVAGYG